MRIPANDEEMRQILTAVIYDALRVPVDTIVPDARIFDDLGAESIDILDIRFRIEEAFDFRIEEGEIIRSIDPALSLDQLRDRFTVGSIVAFLRQKRATTE